MPRTERRAEGSPFSIAAADRERLEKRLVEAVRRARRGREAVLVAVTVPVAGDVDPTAVVAASRGAGEPWWVLEQPDREGSALAALGCAARLDARGPDRFTSVAARWRGLVG
ncbi:MAG: isochorismate synthase, partial [Actinomycetota bacterium]|nr:isochorismate synthase [Actinomycetota bacterium]